MVRNMKVIRENKTVNINFFLFKIHCNELEKILYKSTNQIQYCKEVKKVTVSLVWYTLEGIGKEKFKEIYSEYKQEVGKIGEISLDVTIDNLSEQEEDTIYFEFQHDFKHSTKIRGNLIEYPYSHEAKFWTIFTQNKNYLLISGKEESIKFLVGKLVKICSDEHINQGEMRQILIKPMELTPEHMAKIINKDAISVNTRWFNDLGERETTAGLYGNLEDEHGNRSPYYDKFLKEAKNSPYINFLSETLGYNIGISTQKFSSNKKEATYESFVDYFKDIILAEINL